MGRVRIPRHRLTVTSDNTRGVTTDSSVTTVTTAASWARHCLKAGCKRMRRLLYILFLSWLVCLLAASALSFLVDPPPPPPVPDEAATILAVDTLPQEDSVAAMERELERELGLPRGRQIPAASSFDHRVDEAAKIVAVHIREFRE